MKTNSYSISALDNTLHAYGSINNLKRFITTCINTHKEHGAKTPTPWCQHQIYPEQKYTQRRKERGRPFHWEDKNFKPYFKLERKTSLDAD